MTQPILKASQIDPRVRSGKAAWRHIESELTDVVDTIMATLVPEGPYAYTILPIFGPPLPQGAIPHQKFVNSWPEVRAGYEQLHHFSATGPMRSVAEIRGDWYVFMHGVSEGTLKANNEIVLAQTAVLFPTMGSDGITGELIWIRLEHGSPYTGSRDGPMAAETAILERHEALVDGLRRVDAKAVASLFHSDAQIGVRDNVDDTGTLAEMHSSSELRHYFDRLFARFHVHDISIMHRLASDWFAFAELLWIVEDKADPGPMQRFYTAEFGEVRSDGLFCAYIGHGTDRETIR